MNADYYRWLECEVEPGMWDSERSVRFRVDLENERDDVALLVDEDLVRARGQVERGRRVPGRFRVCLVRQEGGRAVVLLPVQSLKYGSYVVVPAGQLAPS